MIIEINKATNIALLGSVAAMIDETVSLSPLLSLPKYQKKKTLRKITVSIGITRFIILGVICGLASSMAIFISPEASFLVCRFCLSADGFPQGKYMERKVIRRIAMLKNSKGMAWSKIP